MDKKPKLTPLQRRAAHEYLKDFDQTAAYKRAGSRSSGPALESGASRLFAKPQVKKLLLELLEKRNEKVGVDAEWVLRRLVEEVEADVADLYGEDGKLKKVSDWPIVWRRGLVAGFDVDEILVEGFKVGDVKKVRLESRIKRLEMIGKHVNVQAFAERHEHTGKDGGPIETRELSNAERTQRILGLLKHR